MRVIAGAARGRRLTTPPGSRTRPTSDRVKEAWFSSLQGDLPGASVLDLYAGSGALGLEALSRGADHVTFVERDRRALQALRANVEAVGLPGVAVVDRAVAAALAGEIEGAPFDVVVADPPYAVDPDELASLLTVLGGHLAADAVVTIELGRRVPAPAWPHDLLPAEPRRYGDTVLHRATATTPPAVADPGADPT